MPETYTCAKCGGTFDKLEDSEEKALAEKAKDFPDEPLEDMAIVCDDCYVEIMSEDFPSHQE